MLYKLENVMEELEEAKTVIMRLKLENMNTSANVLRLQNKVGSFSALYNSTAFI